MPKAEIDVGTIEGPGGKVTVIPVYPDDDDEVLSGTPLYKISADLFLSDETGQTLTLRDAVLDSHAAKRLVDHARGVAVMSNQEMKNEATANKQPESPGLGTPMSEQSRKKEPNPNVDHDFVERYFNTVKRLSVIDILSEDSREIVKGIDKALVDMSPDQAEKVQRLLDQKKTWETTDQFLQVNRRPVEDEYMSILKEIDAMPHEKKIATALAIAERLEEEAKVHRLAGKEIIDAMVAKNGKNLLDGEEIAALPKNIMNDLKDYPPDFQANILSKMPNFMEEEATMLKNFATELSKADAKETGAGHLRSSANLAENGKTMQARGMAKMREGLGQMFNMNLGEGGSAPAPRRRR
jgi:preprotein translocase subunit Sss1